MTDINASTNARLSREMYSALFKNSQAYYLVGEILADGKVDPKGQGGASDAAALGKLRSHLEAAAKAGHGKLTDEDKALLNALDATSRDGSNADVVLDNLRKIQDLQKQVAEKGLDPTQVDFELKLQTRAEKLLGGSHAMTVSADAKAAAPAGDVCAATPFDASAPLKLAQLEQLPMSNECETNFQEEMARQHLISPIRVAQGQAVKDLAASAENQMALLKKPAQTPDAKLKGDLTRLAGCVDGDKAYVRQVLDSLGLKEAELTKRGVLQPGDPDGGNDQRLKDFLGSQAFSDSLTPAAVNGYRKLLIDTLGNYTQDPSQANYDSLREIVYDHSYVFEDAEGVGEEAVAQYKQMKENILNVSQQSNMLEKVTKPENLPANMRELGDDLNGSARTAEADTVRLAGQIDHMLGTLEAHPELFNQADGQALKTQLDTLVRRDADGKVTGLRQMPPGQEQLSGLNHIWAEVEALGLKAGLGDEFSTNGAMSKALDQAVAKDPAAADDPAVKLLKAAPELAEHSDLLKQLSRPENKALLEAVLNNRGTDVSKYFNEYYGSFLDFSSMLGGMGLGAGAGLALGGLSGGLLGGAIGLGVSYGRSLFGSDSAKDGGLLSKFSFGNLQLNKPTLGSTTASSDVLRQTLAPNGKDMKLFGMSRSDVESVMKLLADKPEARQLLSEQGADLSRMIQDSPAQAQIQTAMDAKRAFNDAFWSNSSSLEDAQASVQAAMAAGVNARVSLTQASLAVGTALEDKSLGEAERKLLEGQKTQLEAAIAAVEKGESMPETSPDLDKTIAAVKSAREQTGVTASEVVLGSARQFAASEAAEPMLKALETAASNGQLQTLLDKLPPEQAAQFRSLAAGSDGQLSSDRLVKGMRRALEAQGGDPQLGSQIQANLKALTGLVEAANRPGATAADVAAYGRQPLDARAALPGSAFDMLSDMAFMQKSMHDLRSTLGPDAMRENAGQFLNEAKRIMQEQAETRPGQPVDRQQLYDRMNASMNALKAETLNDSMLAGLEAGARPPVAETAPEAANVTRNLSSNPLAQGALQNVFTLASAKLQNDPQIKPLLGRLAQGNQTAMAELQDALAKAGDNPANLHQELEAVLARHLPPADAQKLKGALLHEIDTQLGQTIAQAERSLGNYSRTDTRKAQSDVIEALKVYRELVGKSQALDQSDQRVHKSVAQTIRGISTNVGALLNSPGILPEGVSSRDLFYKVFPSLLKSEAPSEADLVQDLSGFLTLDRAGLAEKLGVSQIDDKQFMSIQLAAGTLAMGRFTDDPNRGPVANALAKMVEQTIAHPEALTDPARRSQLSTLLREAGGVSDGAGRDRFLTHLQAFDPDAAKAGQDFASSSDLQSSNRSRIKKMDAPLEPIPPQTNAGSDISDNAVSASAFMAGETTSVPAASDPPATSPASPGASVQPGAVPAAATSAVPDSSNMSQLVSGLAEGLQLRPADLPPGSVQTNDKGEISGPIQIDVQPSPLSPELMSRLWSAGTQALDSSLQTYADMPPETQREVRQNPALNRMLRDNVRQFSDHQQVVSREARSSSRMVDECIARWQVFKYLGDVIGKAMQQNPNLINDMMQGDDKAEIGPNKFELYSPEILAERADQLAKKLLAPAPGPIQQVSMSDAVKDYLNGLRGLPPQAQKLALADLAQRMITSAIHSFYDKAAQENNKRHFKSLDAMAERLHAEIDAELRRTLSQSDASDGGEKGGAALDMAMRQQLETMLLTAQQMSPPMMTDFKRFQILQALFDQDTSNDSQGLLMLAGRQ